MKAVFHPARLSVSVNPPVVTEYVDTEPYTGAYSVTPSQEEQTLETTNKRMTQDVVVNPIPSNYGLISWNGSVITVS